MFSFLEKSDAASLCYRGGSSLCLGAGCLPQPLGLDFNLDIDLDLDHGLVLDFDFDLYIELYIDSDIDLDVDHQLEHDLDIDNRIDVVSGSLGNDIAFDTTSYSKS